MADRYVEAAAKVSPQLELNFENAKHGPAPVAFVDDTTDAVIDEAGAESTEFRECPCYELPDDGASTGKRDKL